MLNKSNARDFSVVKLIGTRTPTIHQTTYTHTHTHINAKLHYKKKSRAKKTAAKKQRGTSARKEQTAAKIYFNVTWC